MKINPRYPLGRSLCLVCAGAGLATNVVAQLADAPEVRVERLADDLHVMFGAGGGQVAGNVLVSVGEQSTLIVDTGFPAFVAGYRDAIAELGGGEILYAVNTHWHDDHSEGNKVLGRGRVVVIAQTSSRAMLMRDNKINVVRTVLDQPAFPAEALPAVTYDDRLELHFNGEPIELLHVAPAHTTGDTAVILRGHNVVHMGDVFLSSAYPFFDVDNGGDFDGLIEFCRRMLDEIDHDTIVVPGHGAVATYDDLALYVDMLVRVRERIAALIADGATLEQVVAAQPTAEWDAKYGNPTTYFIDRAYASLARR